MTDHVNDDDRRPEGVVNLEGVLPHNPADDDDDNAEEEEEDAGNDNGDDDTADSSDNEEELEDDGDDHSDGEESVVPTADEVELEYTYPDDFPDRSYEAWRRVVTHFFRLIIDPSCTNIPNHLFYMCTFLVEIVFPDHSRLTRIGVSTFCECRNLQRMNKFPEGLLELGAHSFADCSSLQGQMTVPESIRYVRDSCFSFCTAITSVVFDYDPTTTTTAAVANPNSVVELGDGIFYCCDELRSVRLPYNIIEIPSFCFYGCPKLTNVPIPVPVRVIRPQAFEDCRSLTSLYISENVHAMCRQSYNRCTALKCITIRSSNIRFEFDVFRGCTALTSIKVLPTVWPKLFEVMNYQPNFIYKFLREYHYQIERFIEWKQNPQVANSSMPSTAFSSMSGVSTQEDNHRIRTDEGKGETKRPILE